MPNTTAMQHMTAVTQAERAAAEALQDLADACADAGMEAEADRVRLLMSRQLVESTKRTNIAAEYSTEHDRRQPEHTDFRNPLDGTVEFNERADPPTVERYAEFVRRLTRQIQSRRARHHEPH